MCRLRTAALLLSVSVCVARADARPVPANRIPAGVAADRFADARGSGGASPKRARDEGQVGPAARPVADGPGREILARKCFQCHQVGMWSSLRQDRKAWESVLYRMVGRGALWTEAEINAMADILAQTRGPVK